MGGNLEMFRDGTWTSYARAMVSLSFDALKVVHWVTTVTESIWYSITLYTPGHLWSAVGRQVLQFSTRGAGFLMTLTEDPVIAQFPHGKGFKAQGALWYLPSRTTTKINSQESSFAIGGLQDVSPINLPPNCHDIASVCEQSEVLLAAREVDRKLAEVHFTMKAPLNDRYRKRGLSLQSLTSLNKESRPFLLGDHSIWSFPPISSLSSCSIWRSWRLL